MAIKYVYFGNTTLRVKNLLENIERQILIFSDIFSHANSYDIWSNDSNLQQRYLEQLKIYGLLNSNKKKTELGTKDARAKSAPLEDYGFVNRKNKIITDLGLEFLELLNLQAFKDKNDFLQIDLISLFFIKAHLNFHKEMENQFERFLQIFSYFDGEISKQNFWLLPLINNFKNNEEFIEFINSFNNSIENQYVFLNLNKEYKLLLNNFICDLELNKSINLEYFKTAKGDESAKSIISALNLFLLYKKSNNDNILEQILNLSNTDNFKKLYLPFILNNSTKKSEKINILKNFCEGTLGEFGKKFYCSIINARIYANLNDYYDLNRRYLNLCGIFNFFDDKIIIEDSFKLILKHSKYKDILKKIKEERISKESLNYLFNDSEILEFLQQIGVKNPKDLSLYNKQKQEQKIHNLILKKFPKDQVCILLKYFQNYQKNSEIISDIITKEASLPTMFEYTIALAWYYLDNCDASRLLNAGLSLDSQMLPKSHAIGGAADFEYKYSNHFLLIEATLTESTNQRRAEMESVSRHLGNLLLKLKEENNSLFDNSYCIFIAPYLDKNVLNDFRSRIYCYFENENNFIKGMNIFPLSTNDLIEILKSKKNYNDIFPIIHEILADKNDFGSRWYIEKIKTFIDKIGE